MAVLASDVFVIVCWNCSCVLSLHFLQG